MKSYLNLVGISAKVHKKQSRMTRLCVILSVFLVTVIIGMANAAINCQINQEVKKGGNWHCLAEVSESDAKLIAKRETVKDAGIFTSATSKDGVKIQGNAASMMILDENIFKDVFNLKVKEGKMPHGAGEILVSEKTKKNLDINVGDTVAASLGEKTFKVKVSGIVEESQILNSKDPNTIVFDSSAYKTLAPGEDKVPLMVRFKDRAPIKNEINNIKSTFNLTDKTIISNGNLLALLMQSDNNYVQQLYLCAVILSLIVLIAGIMMITSSININVSEKTEFFGMMRCLGASRKQVKRYVLLDALGYCKTAVPIALAAAVVVVWILCAILRFAAPGIFEDMPLFDVSWIAVIFGAIMGILTVLLAAMSPARKASKVSPLTAVSGNVDNKVAMKHTANTKLFKVETVLGIHHATGSKKNFVLMICSFALSIVLFLSFNVAVDFMNHAVVPGQPYAADVVIYNKDHSKLNSDVIEKVKTVPGVTKVYPMMIKEGVPVTVGGKKLKVDIVSYEKYLFDWASHSLVSGSVNSVQNGSDAMLLFNDKGKLKPTDTISIDATGDKVKIAAVESNSIYNVDARDGDALFVSESTFKKLTGESNYSNINVQQSRFADSKNADKIKSLIGGDYTVSDRIQTNKTGRGAYYSFAFFVYGFLVVIALIAVANIVNSVAMSVHSHRKQYGFMRAVGMSDRQMFRMVIAETLTYSLWGCVAGCIPGILLNKLIYEKTVTAHWGTAWPFPTFAFVLIIVLVILTSVLAVYSPFKRIRNMSIIKNISAE